MPRPLRNFVAGGIYHVTSRGNRKQPIFLAESDMELFVEILGQVAARLRWRCHAYCLMPNHYHLVLEPEEVNVSTGLRHLNGRYARLFNDKYGLSGHLFQGRFHAAVVASNAHLLEVIRYVVLNPVRAGICSSPDEWPWSSYRAVAGIAQRPEFLDLDRAWQYWREGVHDAPHTFRRFVRDGRVSSFSA